MNIVGAAYIHDTATGKYLETTSGNRIVAYGETTTDVFGSKIDYQMYQLEMQNYVQVNKNHVFANRTLFLTSTGRDRYSFWLYGYERVKTAAKEADYRGNSVLVNNFEYRFPIVNDINYYMWYLFPDFFFKTFYGIVFADIGKSWNAGSKVTDDNIESCFGVGFRIYTFILQMYPLSINYYLSYSPVNNQTVYYLTFGQVF
jgi:outer membrane protein assembly factor BamA